MQEVLCSKIEQVLHALTQSGWTPEHESISLVQVCGRWPGCSEQPR